MTKQEQFEKDYLAAFPGAPVSDMKKLPNGGYFHADVFFCYAVWQQQAKRHAEEVAELVAALRRIADTPPAFIDGQFIVEHHDMDGEFLGAQSIDPVAVVQEMQSVAYNIIAKFDAQKEQS